jgi:hypothetical protein
MLSFEHIKMNLGAVYIKPCLTYVTKLYAIVSNLKSGKGAHEKSGCLSKMMTPLFKKM